MTQDSSSNLQLLIFSNSYLSLVFVHGFCKRKKNHKIRNKILLLVYTLELISVYRRAILDIYLFLFKFISSFNIIDKIFYQFLPMSTLHIDYLSIFMMINYSMILSSHTSQQMCIIQL